ncbi:hypothetical protein DV738_g3169, partial [Chaetothyriales sp. CBS 135597]
MVVLNVLQQVSPALGQNKENGPAKGYIEGLEHRLHGAESLLLQLLPLVTAEQLSAATASASIRDHSSAEQPTTGLFSPPILNKKTGIEYWENFPLDTVENIRRWQADCSIPGQYRDNSTRAEVNLVHTTATLASHVVGLVFKIESAVNDTLPDCIHPDANFKPDTTAMGHSWWWVCKDPGRTGFELHGYIVQWKRG